MNENLRFLGFIGGLLAIPTVMIGGMVYLGKEFVEKRKENDRISFETSQLCLEAEKEMKGEDGVLSLHESQEALNFLASNLKYVIKGTTYDLNLKEGQYVEFRGSCFRPRDVEIAVWENSENDPSIVRGGFQVGEVDVEKIKDYINFKRSNK